MASLSADGPDNQSCGKLQRNGHSGEPQSNGHSEVADVAGRSCCPFCCITLDDWQPHIHMPFRSGETRRCHLECTLNVVRKKVGWGFPPKGVCLETQGIDDEFARDLLEIVQMNPGLAGKDLSVQHNAEEQRLKRARHGWPPVELPRPPPPAFAMEGLREIRISSCAALRTLPADIGLCTSMTSLVLISNGITELPAEVGNLRKIQQLFLNGNYLRTLPEAVGQLPELQEVCLDSNLIEELPPFASRHLKLITAPANKLKLLPDHNGRLDRLDVHGNQLVALTFDPSKQYWDHLISMKVMGNRISKLPTEIELCWQLRTLCVAGNQLEDLPQCIARLRNLEWFFAYNNRLRDLPEGLLCGSWGLERVLLEGNPLSQEALQGLVHDAANSKVHALALDTEQVSAYVAGCEARSEEWKALPLNITVGTLVHSPDSAQYYMKLVRASQLSRRDAGPRATCEPGGPDQAPTRLLVVALAASQGEPEWLGVLRRLTAPGALCEMEPVAGQLTEHVGEFEPGADVESAELKIVRLWDSCVRVTERPKRDAAAASSAGEDFDVLAVIDHRMRWYTEDSDAFARAVEAVSSRYERVVFVGASMGGFGALCHGGRLADATIAFGPQSRLDQATLRPPAEGPEVHEQMSGSLRAAVRSGRRRGALIQVHCAADEHFWHGLNIPLDDLALTVHPLTPRKPFAKLLDRAEILQPILADAISRTLRRPSTRAGAGDGYAVMAPVVDEPGDQDHVIVPASIVVAKWTSSGSFTRFSATREQLLELLFGKAAPYLPRPGDWFCARCNKRIMAVGFWCVWCGVGTEGACVSDPGVSRVPGGSRDFPRPGDWGCGTCGIALCAYEQACTRCGTAKGDSKNVIVP